MKKLWSIAGVCALAVMMVTATTVIAGGKAHEKGRGSGPIVYVISQGKFYDSIITADPLPWKGKFQELRTDGPPPLGLQTQFGPGDSGYRGGRWWMDTNGDGEQDADDHYFSCPLLGPGRGTPY